jgi:hypothetical protein
MDRDRNLKINLSPDPILAMDQVKAAHRLFYVAATPDEYLEWKKDHPDSKDGLPLFVDDYIGHCRYMTSKYSEEDFHKCFESVAPYYRAVLLEYVRRFPMDTPKPGEVPNN